MSHLKAFTRGRRLRLTLAIALGVVPMALAVANAGGAAWHRPAHQSASRSTLANGISPFTQSVHVTDSLQGCRNTGSITLPNGSGKFVCPDAAYTTGNLGKGWNELDLVPFRLTASLGSQSGGTTDYNVVVAGDHAAGPGVGWDVISTPEVNASSAASCTVSAGPNTIGPSLAGGATDSIYEVLTVHQNKGTTCVFDYYMRLAVGAHLYSGSSLQAYLFETNNFSGGQSDVPLPVNQILPQSISKDMHASRGGDQPWNITKSSSSTANFGDICSNGFSTTKAVTVTVTWTKLAVTPDGNVTITTNISAHNPASRSITVNISDQWYEGTDQSTPLGAPHISGQFVVGAGATVTITNTSNTVTSSATHFNDVATGSYTDTVTHVPVPGTTTATADADVTGGANTNATATASDSESITGSGLSFAVAAPSSGAFTGGYTAGTYGVGPVGWSSTTNGISDSGSITFSKTIKLDPAQVTSGALTDRATITGSDGSVVHSAPLTIDVSSQANATLTITKTIPFSLAHSQTFQFHVFADGDSTALASPTITIPAGQTQNTANVTLPEGSYSVSEDTLTGFDPQASQAVTITGCTAGVEFDNTFAPATAFANKITDPTGYESGWTFTLNRPDGSHLSGTTDANGHIIWSVGSTASTSLGIEGTYTISEAGQSGWSEVGAAQAASGSSGTVTGGSGAGAYCSFTVTYPTDAGKTFGCAITNRSRGSVRVIKTLNGGGLGAQSFFFQLRTGASTTQAGTLIESGTATSANSGTITFAAALTPGTTYNICEFLGASSGPSFPSGYGPYNPNDDPSYKCFDFSITPAQAANTPSITFNVDNSHTSVGALTIGYWKNWSGCKKSSGKQTDYLGPTLGAGILLGPLNVTAECAAVNLLSKNNVNGVKEPGDPIYNLAAQELAAKLNLRNGAGSCAALTTAIGQADVLLTTIAFDGVKSYISLLTAAQAAYANQLGATIDAYNNNNLC